MKQIKDSLSGIEVYNIDGYNNARSLTQMWEQVANIKAKMLPIMKNASDGVNMICYSQGKYNIFYVPMTATALCRGSSVPGHSGDHPRPQCTHLYLSLQPTGRTVWR